ncbi:hypothetical protein RT41_GL000194 [Lactococcus fujiensis JCM 16395]|uniref:Glycosyl transferase n=1 Tax=Lactococcus fujiensis JCM 16395 TaxID=1291764 RepID=A0A2A5RPQ4_9LACT|nr:hypothetical protein RT41_GL000194 [Lactococcus fujiensis JCM 16395]
MVGRLGNQMYRYCFARILQEEVKGELFLDFFDVEKHPDAPFDGWVDQLEKFNTRYTKIHNSSYSKVERIKKRFFPPKGLDIKQQILYFFHRCIIEIIYGKYDNLSFNELPTTWKRYAEYLSKNGLNIFPKTTGTKIFPTKKETIYLDSHFGNASYFTNYNVWLNEDFVNPLCIRDNNISFYQTILNTESVCVTIRRGDFLSKDYKDSFFECGDRYFAEGIKMIKEKIEHPVFFFFSDDLDYASTFAQHTLRDNEIYFIEQSDNSVVEKVTLMSSCKHFIISNSTFSWWVQYLGNSSNKIVVAPEHWYVHRIQSHALIEEESWIRVPDKFLD